MKGAEFVERQAWLPFVDAVGIVLQVLEPVKRDAWTWFKKWKKAFITKPVKVVKFKKQLVLFHWATTETMQLFS